MSRSAFYYAGGCLAVLANVLLFGAEPIWHIVLGSLTSIAVIAVMTSDKQ